MPCTDGTSVLMMFDDIINAISYICELADALSASLFLWTFCHALPNAQCECRISVPLMGVLLEEDIMKLYTKFVPLLFQQKRNKTKETIMHHIRKEYDNQKQLGKLPKDENMINCINRHQGQRGHQNKINRDENMINFINKNQEQRRHQNKINKDENIKKSKSKHQGVKKQQNNRNKDKNMIRPKKQVSQVNET